jgi:hypothetical protein
MERNAKAERSVEAGRDRPQDSAWTGSPSLAYHRFHKTVGEHLKTGHSVNTSKAANEAGQDNSSYTS